MVHLTKRRVALLAALVAIALAVRPALSHLRAASLLVRFVDPSATGLLADWARHPIRESYEPLAIPGGFARARLYVPRDVENPPAIVIVHGVHRTGVDEPRLQRFARTIAETGVAVMTPELRELCDFRIDPRSIDTIGAAMHAQRERFHARTVGVMGLSFAGGLVLMAAADPRYAADAGFAVSVGGHDDLARVLRFFATDTIALPDGTTEHLHAHDYGPLVLVYAHVESFFPAADVPAARDALRAWLWEDFDTGRARAKELSEASRAKLERLFSHDVSGIAPELLSEIAKNEAAMPAVSPDSVLARIAVPVFLLHGAGDTVIPASETRWLASHTPASLLRGALVSPAISHVELSGEPTLADQWALVHFMAAMLDQADRGAAAP